MTATSDSDGGSEKTAEASTVSRPRRACCGNDARASTSWNGGGTDSVNASVVTWPLRSVSSRVYDGCVGGSTGDTLNLSLSRSDNCSSGVSVSPRSTNGSGWRAVAPPPGSATSRSWDSSATRHASQRPGADGSKDTEGAVAPLLDEDRVAIARRDLEPRRNRVVELAVGGGAEAQRDTAVGGGGEIDGERLLRVGGRDEAPREPRVGGAIVEDAVSAAAAAEPAARSATRASAAFVGRAAVRQPERRVVQRLRSATRRSPARSAIAAGARPSTSHVQTSTESPTGCCGR